MLSYNTINNRVKRRRNDNIKVGKKNVDVSGNISAKLMNLKGEKCWCVERKHDIDMRATGAESLQSSIPGREAEDSMEDLDIAKDNCYSIQNQVRDGTQAIDDVHIDASTGQAGNAHVLIVCVWNNDVHRREISG